VKTEEAILEKMMILIYQTTRHHIPEDTNLQGTALLHELIISISTKSPKIAGQIHIREFTSSNLGAETVYPD
jgi:hypothetical protein